MFPLVRAGLGGPPQGKKECRGLAAIHTWSACPLGSTKPFGYNSSLAIVKVHRAQPRVVWLLADR